MFAGNRSTVGYSMFGTGRVEPRFLRTAVESLLYRYPVLAARIVASGAGWVIEPTRQLPELRVGTETDMPATGFDVVGPDAVCALDLGQREGDFRLTLLIHHSVADAPAALRYLETLCELYTDAVSRGSPRTQVARPLSPSLPLSLEEFLASRGFDVPAKSAPGATGARPAGGITNVPRLRHERTRLTRSQTDVLFGRARHHRLTVHGVVCSAILLAAHELSGSNGPTPFGVVSSVDLRTRAGAPIAPEMGTVIQGLDTAVVTVTGDDDPIRLGRAVLKSLAVNLANRDVHQTFLRSQELRRPEARNPLMVANWGRIPTLQLPSGVRVNDFRASAHGLRMDRAHTAAPSFFITTCDGRLSIDHPAWVIDDSAPTVAWGPALQRAFLRITDVLSAEPVARGASGDSFGS